jgi:hypothetical protein
MSRPIEATPTITGKAAKELLKELDAPLIISSQKQEELDRRHALYIKFSNQKLNVKS